MEVELAASMGVAVGASLLLISRKRKRCDVQSMQAADNVKLWPGPNSRFFPKLQILICTNPIRGLRDRSSRSVSGGSRPISIPLSFPRIIRILRVLCILLVVLIGLPIVHDRLLHFGRFGRLELARWDDVHVGVRWTFGTHLASSRSGEPSASRWSSRFKRAFRITQLPNCPCSEGSIFDCGW